MFRNFTYPGSDFHEMNLDWLLCMCQKFAGLRLEVQGDYLRLVNERDEVVSSVQVSYADHALKDIDGNMIQSYIISAGTSGDTVVFTKGDNSVTAITVPYANKAKYDIDGHEIEDYVLHTQIAGDKLRITKGDGTVAELTIPYAIRATDDEEGNDITTYATTLAVDGDNVVLRDRKGRLLNSITVAYAIKALQDVDGNAIKSTYASELQTGTTTVILKSSDGTVLSTITVPYATEASHAVDADHADLADDATNAIETVAIVGDQIIFTTYGGTQTAVTVPYAVKALKDGLGNEITETYVANVGTNVNTGEIIFYDAEGNTIVSIVPQVEKAKKDTYNNLIADYIKQILVDVNSNYVTVVHGTGTTDSLIINYATKALNDLNDQAIHNTYISYIECVEDVDDGHYKLVCYDGDTPKAELFRFEVTAYSAQTDINGKDLTTYVADVDYNASKQIEVTDGGGNVLKTLANKVANIADVNLTSLADGQMLAYDANADEWVNVNGGGLQPYSGATFLMGGWYNESNGWQREDVEQYTEWTTQDYSWFKFLQPYVGYAFSGSNQYYCYRVSDQTKVEIIPGSWIQTDMMPGFALAISDGLNLQSTCYYGIPNNPDKLIKVYIELTAGVTTTSTAQIVSAEPAYTKLGSYNLANSQYTDESGASILASAGANSEIVISATNTMIGDIAVLHATAVSVAVSNGGTPQFIEDVPSVLLAEIAAGKHVETYIFDFVYELPTTQRSRAEIQLVIDSSTQTVLNNSFNLIST